MRISLKSFAYFLAYIKHWLSLWSELAQCPGQSWAPLPLTTVYTTLKKLGPRSAVFQWLCFMHKLV